MRINLEVQSEEQRDRAESLGLFLREALGSAFEKKGILEKSRGDASTKEYSRVTLDGKVFLLLSMDDVEWNNGLASSSSLPITNREKTVTTVLPFIAVSDALRMSGFCVPRIYHYDLGRGFVLMEYVDAPTFEQAVGAFEDPVVLWKAAIDLLIDLRDVQFSIPFKIEDYVYLPPQLDLSVFLAEAELIGDWYWPLLHPGSKIADVGLELLEHWQRVFENYLLAASSRSEQRLVLRDFHSPNLLWLGNSCAGKVCLLDFQDALFGHAAYDLASVVFDARYDLPKSLCVNLIYYYCDNVGHRDRQFSREEFRRAVAIFGAQRSSKILGVFARLALRDGRREYLVHLDRNLKYLSWCLAHPDLADVRRVYEKHFRLCV